MKYFLATLGTAYILLAAWCSLLPASTSKAVGFDLQMGAGQSEYLVIYGGLQLALGFLFLWPMFRQEVAQFSLGACVLVHACLVFFRSLGFVLYAGIGGLTVGLAIVEWLIFLFAASLLYRSRH